MAGGRLPEITKDDPMLPKFKIAGKVSCQKPPNSIEQERTERTEAEQLGHQGAKVDTSLRPCGGR